MSASNTLKSQKLHFHQRKPENNNPVLLKVMITILVHKGSRLQLEKVQLCVRTIQKSVKTRYGLLSLQECT